MSGKTADEVSATVDRAEKVNDALKERDEQFGEELVDESTDDPVEEIDPAIAAFLKVLSGAGLVAMSARGVTTLMFGGDLGGYGTVGALALFLIGVGVLYTAGVSYGRETAEKRGRA